MFVTFMRSYVICQVICQVLSINLVLWISFLSTFEKERRRFFAFKAMHFKVNIFLYCEFICKFSFSCVFFSYLCLVR